MSQKHSEAKRKYWKTVDPEKRTKIMSKVAFFKHAKLTPEQRTENALKMLKARWGDHKK